LKKSFSVVPALVLGLAVLTAHAQTPTKVAIIHVQSAILATKDGQKAQQDLQSQFNPKKATFEKKQQELANLQEQMKKGSATMSDAARDKMAKDIDTLNKSLTRDDEDFQAEVQQEEQKIMNDLGQKMMDVIIKYATQNGFAMVVDVSNPQTPVLWADSSINITEAIVKLYDQGHPGGASPATAKPASGAKPATPPPPAPKQTPPAPTTKK
jgi:outer membrane protein